MLGSAGWVILLVNFLSPVLGSLCNSATGSILLTISQVSVTQWWVCANQLKLDKFVNGCFVFCFSERKCSWGIYLNKIKICVTLFFYYYSRKRKKYAVPHYNLFVYMHAAAKICWERQPSSLLQMKDTPDLHSGQMTRHHM